MINGIIPMNFYEKCKKCNYRQIRSVSCTTHFSTCPKCGGIMEKIKEVSKPNIGDNIWVSVLNMVNRLDK